MDTPSGRSVSRTRWSVLVPGFVVTMVASLSVHAVMLDDLHVPYPYRLPHTGWPAFPDFVALSFATVAIYALIRPKLARSASAMHVLVLFLLIAGLKEALFRDVFMNMINAKRVTIYPVVQWLPKLVPLAALATIIVPSAALMSSTWRKVCGAVLIGGVVFFLVKVTTDSVFARILAAIEYLDPANRFDPPYDYHILIPAYLTFAEPVAASFAVGLLAWDRLSRHTLTRIAQLAALILLAKGPVFKPFINIVYARTDAVTAMLSVGQFSFETITLGVLTGTSLTLALRDRAAALSAKPINPTSQATALAVKHGQGNGF